MFLILILIILIISQVFEIMPIININHIIASLKVFRKLLLNISHKNGKIILIGTLPYQ